MSVGIIEDVVRFCLLQELDFMKSNDFNKVYTFLKRQHGDELTASNVILSIPSLDIFKEPRKSEGSKPSDLNFYKLNTLVTNLLIRVTGTDLSDLESEKYSIKYITTQGILTEFYDTHRGYMLWEEALDESQTNFIRKIRSKMELSEEARIHLLKICSEYYLDSTIQQYTHYALTKLKKRTKRTDYIRPDLSFSFMMSLALGNLKNEGLHMIQSITSWLKDHIDTHWSGGTHPSKMESQDCVLRQVLHTCYVSTYYTKDLATQSFWRERITSDVAEIARLMLRNNKWYAESSGDQYIAYPNENSSGINLVKIFLNVLVRHPMDEYTRSKICSLRDMTSYTAKSIGESLIAMISELDDKIGESILKIVRDAKGQSSPVSRFLKELLEKLVNGVNTEEKRREAMSCIDECYGIRAKQIRECKNFTPETISADTFINPLMGAYIAIKYKEINNAS